MTTETEFKISEEPLAERVLRQVPSGTFDESRLLPSAEKLARDVGKKLGRLRALKLRSAGLPAGSRMRSVE